MVTKDVLCVYFAVFQSSSNTDVKTLRDFHTVASLQDQAQMTLSKYIQTSYPTQPFRFGKLLLLLPTLKTIQGGTIEELFFRKTIGSIPIERLLIDMFKSNDFWQAPKTNWFQAFARSCQWYNGWMYGIVCRRNPRCSRNELLLQRERHLSLPVGTVESRTTWHSFA